MSEPTKEDLRTLYCRGADPLHMICWDVLGADIDEDGLRAVYESGLAAARAEGEPCFVLCWRGSPDPDDEPCLCTDNGRFVVSRDPTDVGETMADHFDPEDERYEIRPARLILSPAGEGG